MKNRKKGETIDTCVNAVVHSLRVIQEKQKKGETIDTCVNAVIMRRIEMPSVSKRQNFISGDGKKWLTKNEKCVIHDLKKADKNVFFDSQNVVKNTQTLLVTEVSQSHSGRK